MIEKISYQLCASICVGLLMIGGVLGWMSFLLFGDSAQQTQVVVVSKAAIAKLERERIKSTGGDMFFGKPDVAIKLIEQIGKSYEKRNVKLVFVNDDTGSCLGGVAGSVAVHEAVISALKKRAPSNSK